MKNRFIWIWLFTAFPMFGCDLTVRLEQYSAQSQLVTSDWQGLDVELAKALLDKAGCSYRFINLPWGRALKLLQQGKIDMMLSVSKTAERSQHFYFIGPQRNETLVFATLSANSPITQFEDLFQQDKPFALQRGAFYGKAFHRYLTKYKNVPGKVIYVADNKSKVDLLKVGRVSGYLEAKLNVFFERDNIKELANLQIQPLIINRAPVYFAFSKQSLSQQNLNRLERSYQQNRDSRVFKKILTKYHVD